MRNMGKREIEELLSAYIDGELSSRRRMEVRRLVENNADAAALLQFLEKQKELLNAMPTEAAPVGLANRVLLATEQDRTELQTPVAPAARPVLRLQKPAAPVEPIAVEPVELISIEPQAPAAAVVPIAIEPPMPAAAIEPIAAEPQITAVPVGPVAAAPPIGAVPVVSTTRRQMPATPVLSTDAPSDTASFEFTAVAREAGERQLLMRRVLTAAAMLFIPVVVLGLVVWGIVGPLNDPGGADKQQPVREPGDRGACCSGVFSAECIALSDDVAADADGELYS